jgi:hypothetical protein
MKEQPSAAIRWSDRRLRSGYLAIAIAGLVGLVLLPRVMTNGDEYIYAGEARILAHGRLLPVAGDPLPSTRAGDFEGPRYPPGWPLLLALGAPLGFRAMFAVALALHLVGGAATARMAVRRGLPSFLAAAWLVHPLFWSFSRTLMSDLPSAGLLLVAMDAWENHDVGRSAVAVGYSFLMRVASFTQVSGFALAIAGDRCRRCRALGTMALGAACGAAALLLVNRLKYGHPWHSSYAFNNVRLLTTAMVKQNLCIYLLGLLLIPPFPLLWLVIRRQACDRWALVAVPIVLFFLFYGYREHALGLVDNFLVGQRLILAAHAALFIATMEAWSRLSLVRHPAALSMIGVALVTLHHVWTMPMVEHYAPAARALAACRPEKVAFSVYAGRIAFSTNASSYQLIREQAPVTLPDAAVVTLRFRNSRDDTPIGFELPFWLGQASKGCRRLGDFYILDLGGRCPVDGEECDPSALRTSGRPTRLN